MFTGTIRENIDPYKQFPDEKIWDALAKVKLKNVISDLDLPVEENGVGFSVGQKQLICLARAALKHNKIVILDEATANMDAETETLLYSVVDNVFSECTILIIAHRLDYITKCDRVIIIDSGIIREYENPQILLRNRNSYFYRMCIHNKNSKDCIN